MALHYSVPKGKTVEVTSAFERTGGEMPLFPRRIGTPYLTGELAREYDLTILELWCEID